MSWQEMIGTALFWLFMGAVIGFVAREMWNIERRK